MAARPAGKLDFDGVGWSTVRTLLDWKWSPQQTAATFMRQAYTRAGPGGAAPDIARL